MISEKTISIPFLSENEERRSKNRWIIGWTMGLFGSLLLGFVLITGEFVIDLARDWSVLDASSDILLLRGPLILAGLLLLMLAAHCGDEADACQRKRQ